MQADAEPGRVLGPTEEAEGQDAPAKAHSHVCIWDPVAQSAWGWQEAAVPLPGASGGKSSTWAKLDPVSVEGDCGICPPILCMSMVEVAVQRQKQLVIPIL